MCSQNNAIRLLAFIVCDDRLFTDMAEIYQADLAYVQATGFADFAQGAAPEIVRRLHSRSIPVHRVVEIGCGAGPMTVTLVGAGFVVTGIDVSTELLNIARQAAPVAEFIQGSIYELQIPDCEALIAVGEPLTYHDADGDARLREFFQRASSVLSARGILIFDLIESGEPSLSARGWRSGTDWAVLVDTKEDADSRTLVREIETFRKVGELYRRGREAHRVRVFKTSEVCDWLEAAGFDVTTAQSYGEFSLPLRRRAFFCTRRNG